MIGKRAKWAGIIYIYFIYYLLFIIFKYASTRGVYDVAFYLVLSSSTDFLNANEEGLLTLYQAELEKANVKYTMDELMQHYKIALVTSWAVIVYVTGLLDTSWTEKIKIAAKRTIAAVERLGAAQLAIDKILEKVHFSCGLSCLVYLSCMFALPCLALSCRALFCLALPCLVLSCFWLVLFLA